MWRKLNAFNFYYNLHNRMNSVKLVSCDISPCSTVETDRRRCRGVCCLSDYFYRTAWHNIRQDSHIHTHRLQNLTFTQATAWFVLIYFGSRTAETFANTELMCEIYFTVNCTEIATICRLCKYKGRCDISQRRPWIFVCLFVCLLKQCCRRNIGKFHTILLLDW